MRPMIADGVERGRAVAAALHLECARLGSAMEAIHRLAGFPAVVAASRTELQSLAAKLQEEGADLDGWIS